MPKKYLVIVESPAKAKTISRFLGKQYDVAASIGHVRDLPKSAKEMPESLKKETWAHLGVNTDSAFQPFYVVTADKKKQIKILRDLLKEADCLYLATDEDREGEAISWHLCEELKPKVPVHRLVFHEITKPAIEAALANPRDIDMNLVRAQEARRIVDRLYGYGVSPILWYKVRPKLSAGRVQSVAVRLIVQRERDRMAFHQASYWDILGTFATLTQPTLPQSSGKQFQATLVEVGGRRIPSGKDFDPNTGKLSNPSLLLLWNEVAAELLRLRLVEKTPLVRGVEVKPYTTRPYPPFTTSTLQQEANRKFGFTARETMSIAQNLYENGYITYMRTDSTNLSGEAMTAARRIIKEQYGAPYLPDSPRYYQTKVKNAQEAHEAIRPAGNSFPFPDQLRSSLGTPAFKLYDLIWKRTVASQMTDARGQRMTISVGIDDAVFEVSGKTIEFPGYLRAYVEGSDDPEADLADREVLLPAVQPGETLATCSLEPKSHTTKPPARFTEAALTRVLEEKGIGRPSTYASIIETILNRSYVFKKTGALVPTWVAFAVCQLLETHLPNLVDYDFTALMEDQLDAISRGERDSVEYLRTFYGSDDTTGLRRELKEKENSIDARSVSSIPIGFVPKSDGGSADGPAETSTDINTATTTAMDTETMEPLCVRVGKFGPYLQYGERRVSVPEDLPPDELSVEKAMELLNQTAQVDTPLGNCPETGKPIFVKVGRFGPYVQRGEAVDGEKPQNCSLLKGMEPEQVDLATALKLLSLPRTLGTHPETGVEIIAQNGRFGPYVKSGTETRSLPANLSPLDVTVEQAVDLLSKPKYGSRSASGSGGKRAPLREWGISPVTGKSIQLLDGRYGKYVTDGETNVTLPKDTDDSEIPLEYVLTLLAERAAKVPAKKTAKRSAKTTTKPTVTRKKTTAKRTTAKKATTVKKTAKKVVKKTAKK